MSATKTRIMYIQRGSGLSGTGRIGRVTLSKTGRTLYYQEHAFASLGGSGYKTSHLDEGTREEYWISGPRKDGQDTLYPGTVEIDDDVREKYWIHVREQPERAHQNSFRSMGRNAKRPPA
jgi:hypothetical protein